MMLDEPELKHPVLTPQEMAMICDVCNPGFRIEWDMEKQDPDAGWLAACIRANVEDSFSLYPGNYEEKWGVDRQEFCQKLWQMTPAELAQVAGKVDRFWAKVNSH